MPIKRLITADEFSKLVPQFQGEYKKQDDGSYVLDLTDYEDPAALKRAKDFEKKEAAEAKRLLKEAQDNLSALTEERDNLIKGAIPKADVEKLESSYKTKLAAREKELTAQIETANAGLQKLLVDNVAKTLAAELSTAPAVMIPHIKSRLRAEKNTAGEFETKILDADGKLSALTIEDLKKEFIDNKDFSAILVGSKGSGGGAGGNGGGGGASPKKLKDMTATEEAQFANAHPQEYARMLEAGTR